MSPGRLRLGDVERARAVLAGHLRPTPLRRSGAAPGVDLRLKLECWQPTGSFKVRGAIHFLSTLSEEERRRGVVAASAGNHALGVAFAASRLGGSVRARLFVPRTAPRSKVDKLRLFPVEVQEWGDTYDDAVEAAHACERETGAVYVPAYEDQRTAAGQGTVGLEVLDECPEVGAVLVPVGGGGLIAGIGLALKTLKPKIRIIGVQAESLPSMKAALEKGEPVGLPPALTIADGIAVRTVGAAPLELVKSFVDEIVTVDEGEIANAVLLLLEIEKSVAEGAAAVPLAALLNKKISLDGTNVGLIVSGGNIDVNLIARIIEKGLIQDGRLSRVSVVIPDRPGNLARLAQRIADLGANILQIAQARGFGQMAIGETEVELILETTGPEHIERLCAGLRAEGLRFKTES